MKPLWTAVDAAAATRGRSTGDWHAAGISIDSRTILPGDLFFAIKGPSFDGHHFAADAIRQGAAAVVVERRPAGLADDAPVLMVGDTARALSDLAAAARARSTAKIAAVTGSVGKTGTKDMLAAALAGQGRVTSTVGNLNNHLGLPLSLARLGADDAFAVFEMGMNHAGEISPLSKLARPHVAMVTTIAPVHIEFFQSIDGIADAKAEIFDGLEPGGSAVINRDTPFFDRLSAAAKERGAAMVWGFGVHSFANARLLAFEPDENGSRVEATVGSRHLRYRLQLRGKHWALNSIGVLAAAGAMGADLEQAAAALGAVEPPKGRGRSYTVETGDGAFTVIDETYNASPVAMQAAFEVLADSKPGRGGRRIVVLGDMLELGAEAEAAHLALADAVLRLDFDLVFASGSIMPQMLAALPADRRGGTAATSADLAPIVAARLRAGDLVLIKGSAGAKMSVVVEALKAMHQAGGAES